MVNYKPVVGEEDLNENDIRDMRIGDLPPSGGNGVIQKVCCGTVALVMVMYAADFFLTEQPTGPPHPSNANNPRLFFDVSADGQPMGRIEMEVRFPLAQFTLVHAISERLVLPPPSFPPRSIRTSSRRQQRIFERCAQERRELGRLGSLCGTKGVTFIESYRDLCSRGEISRREMGGEERAFMEQPFPTR